MKPYTYLLCVYLLGRGILTSAPFEKGDFSLEYQGELISKNVRRDRLYHDSLKVFMFEFHLLENCGCAYYMPLLRLIGIKWHIAFDLLNINNG